MLQYGEYVKATMIDISNKYDLKILLTIKTVRPHVAQKEKL